MLWARASRLAAARRRARPAALILALATAGWAPAASASPVVDASLSGASQPIPPSFLGLSFEYDQLSTFEKAGPLLDRMLRDLHSGDGHPLYVRLGGRSADYIYWDPPAGSTIPGGVYVVKPQWLTDLGQLVRKDDLNIGLDLNLAVHSPDMEVSFVRAARRALPPNSVSSVAFGNEPDLYFLQPWMDKERVSTTLKWTPRHWIESYDRNAERRIYRAYAGAFRNAFPHLALQAPDLAFPNPTWVSRLTSLKRLSPNVISIHRYATAYCRRIHYNGAPKVSTFLKNGTSAGLAGSLRSDLAVAAQAKATVRVSEMNSVTCGGEDGVANSFATALWAPDVLFEFMREGVVGANFHIRPRLPNAPFHIDAGGVEAAPELYGLSLFAKMIGRSPMLQGVDLPPLAGHPLKAWAVSSSYGLKLLLINKSSRRMIVRFSLPGARRTASIVRLLARSPAATSGVTLGGQSIGTDGRWHGQRHLDSVTPNKGVYRISVPRYSSAMVKLGHA